MTLTYGVLLKSALRTGVAALSAKALAVVLLANLAGAAVELEMFGGVVPYLAITAPPDTFLSVSTHSTLAMAVVVALSLVPTVLRPDYPTQVTWGRIVGVVIAAETVALQGLLHALGAPTIRPDRLWWLMAAIAAGVVLGSAGLGFDRRARRADPLPDTPARPQEAPTAAAA